MSYLFKTTLGRIFVDSNSSNRDDNLTLSNAVKREARILMDKIKRLANMELLEDKRRLSRSQEKVVTKVKGTVTSKKVAVKAKGTTTATRRCRLAKGTEVVAKRPAGRRV